ncbi:MAG: hypothetical protein WHS82_03420 [Candidatus Methanosuratincola sp.]
MSKGRDHFTTSDSDNGLRDRIRAVMSEMNTNTEEVEDVISKFESKLDDISNRLDRLENRVSRLERHLDL